MQSCIDCTHALIFYEKLQLIIFSLGKISLRLFVLTASDFHSIFPLRTYVVIVGRFPERHDETLCEIPIKLQMLTGWLIKSMSAFISWYRHCPECMMFWGNYLQQGVFCSRSSARLLWPHSKVFRWLVYLTIEAYAGRDVIWLTDMPRRMC